ncbi:hypothetical protein POX_b02656 [Penicillium oxalicum]|uniref:hypothetical protein n=1 Tax=Penicillium oxalicum TaxID=69781 RepID=UPI0020B89F3D|nr:hypothetical protein POX_b02656 [Penicillium oxalicum]KAI2792617.1 hypothetical protein POX_b02656 [Penicillium oxalicum]
MSARRCSGVVQRLLIRNTAAPVKPLPGTGNPEDRGPWGHTLRGVGFSQESTTQFNHRMAALRMEATDDGSGDIDDSQGRRTALTRVSNDLLRWLNVADFSLRDCLDISDLRYLGSKYHNVDHTCCVPKILFVSDSNAVLQESDYADDSVEGASAELPR